MVRQALSILIAIALVANQLATFPHAHAGVAPAEQNKHGRSLHFHVGSGWHSHQHTPQRPRRCSAAAVSGPGWSHDADAVYLPTGCQASVKPSAGSDSGAAAMELSQPTSSVSAVRELRKAWGTFHPPNVMPGAGSIYLTVRTLRI